VRFGIAHELYAYEQNWVQMDGDGKYAKPVEDPAAAYTRRYGKAKPAVVKPSARAAKASRVEAVTDLALASDVEVSVATEAPAATLAEAGPHALDEQSCPKCGGRMWDNRLTKRNPKAPDYKCRDRSCDGVIWPPKGEKAAEPAKAEKRVEETEEIPF
jgi:hypothetical protein